MQCIYQHDAILMVHDRVALVDEGVDVDYRYIKVYGTQGTEDSGATGFATRLPCGHAGAGPAAA